MAGNFLEPPNYRKCRSVSSLPAIEAPSCSEGKAGERPSFGRRMSAALTNIRKKSDHDEQKPSSIANENILALPLDGRRRHSYAAPHVAETSREDRHSPKFSKPSAMFRRLSHAFTGERCEEIEEDKTNEDQISKGSENRQLFPSLFAVKSFDYTFKVSLSYFFFLTWHYEYINEFPKFYFLRVWFCLNL